MRPVRSAGRRPLQDLLAHLPGCPAYRKGEVSFLPNLLADAPLFPEFIQGAATARNVAGAALDLLAEPGRRADVKKRLAEVVASLGGPGAARRAAAAILRLMSNSSWL